MIGEQILIYCYQMHVGRLEFVRIHRYHHELLFSNGSIYDYHRCAINCWVLQLGTCGDVKHGDTFDLHPKDQPEEGFHGYVDVEFDILEILNVIQIVVADIIKINNIF